MARLQADRALVPSLLDRLIDTKPAASTDLQAHRFQRLSQLIASVKQDLEWLLNTRQSLVDIPDDLHHLRDSLLSFGLPDFTHFSLDEADDRYVLQRTVEAAIRRFEPRLDEVVVTLVEIRESDRNLRFRIDARLLVEPAPEAVTFDSVLDLSTKAFVIKAD